MTTGEEQDFAAASTAKKQEILLDPNVSSAKVVEYLSLCGTTSCKNVFSEEVEEKIEPHCNDPCKERKMKTDRDLIEIETNVTQLYDKKIKKKKDEIVWLEKSAKACSLLSKAALDLRQLNYDPEKQERILHRKIDDAVREGLLEPSIGEDLKKKTSSALEIDPSAPAASDTNSVKTTYDSVHKAIRLRQGICKKEEKGLKKRKLQGINYLNTIKRETTLTSMNADAASKTLGATGSILSGVSKLMEAEEETDDGEKAKKIIGGVLDIANAAAQFLPPPASLVTETAVGIFDVVAGAPPDPSNQQVIDEVKFAIESGFARQQVYLERKFEEHLENITGQFNELEGVMKEEFQKMESLMEREFQKLDEKIEDGFNNLDDTINAVSENLNNSINKGFEDLKNFTDKHFEDQKHFIDNEFEYLRHYIAPKFTEDHLRRVKNDALAQLEALLEKQAFIEHYRNDEIDDISIANSIDRQVATLANTHSSALIKTTFEDICPYILDSSYVVSKTALRQYCASLLYTYLTIEQDRTIVLMQLITVLEKSPLRKNNEGYLKVHHHQKNEIMKFVRETVLNEDIGCSLFRPALGTPVLTNQQMTQISTYIEMLSKDFKGSMNAFRDKADCPRMSLSYKLFTEFGKTGILQCVFVCVCGCARNLKISVLIIPVEIKLQHKLNIFLTLKVICTKLWLLVVGQEIPSFCLCQNLIMTLMIVSLEPRTP